MAERVLVTWRDGAPFEAKGGAASLAPGGEAAAAADDLDGLQVVQRVNQGLIARTPDGGAADPALYQELEARGRRIKRLYDTDIIEVGTYRLNVESPGVDRKVPARLRVPAEMAQTWPHHLVQLAGPPTPEWMDRIEKAGVDVAEPISRYALFVCARPDQVAALHGLRLDDDDPQKVDSFVTWTGPFHPGYRLSRNVQDRKGTVTHLLVTVYPDTAAPTTRGAIEAIGLNVVHEWGEEGRYRDRFAFLVVEADRKAAAPLARLPHVRAVESHTPALSSDSERSAQIIAAQLDGTAPVAGYRAYLAARGLDGSGVTVGICDSGVDTNDDTSLHLDLRGRLAFFEDVTGGATVVDENGHGTHVAGIAVGSGASGAFNPGGWTLGLGVAPAARFGVINAVLTTNSPGTIEVARYARMMVSQGAQVMNNSWRQGGPAGYTTRAAEVDRLVRDPTGPARTRKEGDYLVLVFSAGNEGADRKTITEPKEAKNPIVVGSSLNWNQADDDIRSVAPSSSRGPARDGRILPTIVAPGEKVVSTRTTFKGPKGQPMSDFKDDAGTEHTNHAIQSGTSTAAPHVAGVCALLIQWWRARDGGRNPSPAMLKALLVNGAEDLAGGLSGRFRLKVPLRLGHIPNSDQGWGRVCVQNILAGPKILRDQEHPFRSTKEAPHTFMVRASDPTRPLKITMAWTDAPGAPNASPALINDLDLEVVETLEDGTRRIFKGNNFVRGFSVPSTVKGKGDFDSLNNVECVYIRRPAGTYLVSVLPHTLTGSALPPYALTSAYQDYALVVDNAIEVPPT